MSNLTSEQSNKMTEDPELLNLSLESSVKLRRSKTWNLTLEHAKMALEDY